MPLDMLDQDTPRAFLPLRLFKKQKAIVGGCCTKPCGKVKDLGRGRASYSIPVISSRAGGRKFQKEKETIGRSDALLIFAPDTHVLQWSAIALNARIPPIKLESLLLITFL